MLTQDDYKVILAVLDAGSQKGLFRPADFATIGNLYGKVQMLAESPPAQEKPQVPPAPQSVPGVTTTTTLNPNT